MHVLSRASRPTRAKKRWATPPSFVASASGNNAALANTSYTVTIPAGASAGQFAILLVCQSAQSTGNATVGTITGWDRVFLRESLASEQASYGIGVALFTRRLEPGDPGANVTVPMSPTGQGVSVMAVYDNCGGVSAVAAPLGFRDANILVSQTDLLRYEPVYTRPCDLAVGLGASELGNTGGTNQPGTTPSGFTQRVFKEDTRNGLAIFKTGAWIIDGAYDNANGVVLMADAPVNNISFSTMMLSLYGEGAQPMDAWPTSLKNKSIEIWGESENAIIQNGDGSNAGHGHFSKSIVPSRLAAISQPSAFVNRARGGTIVPDNTLWAFGAYSGNTVAVPTDTHYVVNRTGPWVPGQADIVIAAMIGNDVLTHRDPASSATPAKHEAAVEYGLSAWLRLLRAESIVQPSDGTVSLSGSWSTDTSTKWSGGTAHQTTTPGDTATITVTEPDIDVILIGQDDAYDAGADSATVTVTIDGQPHVTNFDLNGLTTRGEHTPEVAQQQIAIPCRDMGAGEHDIVITHAGASGEVLRFDCYLIPNEVDPPIVVLSDFWKPSDAFLGPWEANDYAQHPASWDAIRAAQAGVVAEFDDGRVSVVSFDDFGWDPDVHAGTDGLHLGYVGTAFVTQRIARHLMERYP